MRRMIGLVGLLLAAPVFAQVTLNPGQTVSVQCSAPAPVPVDCLVSEFGEWTGGAWSACVNGSQTRQETRTRTIVTEPANGGAQCPSLREDRVATQACTVTPPPTGALVFFDDFGYVVNELDTFAVKDAAFKRAGWSGMKDIQNRPTDPGRAKGYLSTVSTIPGYAGPNLGGRWLKLRGLPSDFGGISQTDFYLAYGSPGSRSIPGNAWYQFVVYIDPTSHWDARGKIIYPSDDGNASGGGGETSGIFTIRPSNQAGQTQPYGPNASISVHVDAQSIQSNAPEGADRLGNNLNGAAGVLRGGLPYVVTIHYDTSGVQGIYEQWVAPLGSEPIKVAEWIGGVTPGLNWVTWPALRGGQNMLKIPTTWGRSGTTSTNFNATIYIKDFSIGRSRADLRVYH